MSASMCAVSMILDHYIEKWEPLRFLPSPTIPPDTTELEKLYNRAKRYDEEHQQPDCELEEKLKLLREIAKTLGVKITI